MPTAQGFLGDVLGILQVVQNGLGRASVLGNGGFLRGHLAVDDGHMLGVVNGGIVGGQDFHVIGTALVVSAGVDVGDDIRRGFRGGAGQIVIEDVQNFHCHLGILAVLADHQEPVGGVFVVGVDDAVVIGHRIGDVLGLRHQGLDAAQTPVGDMPCAKDDAQLVVDHHGVDVIGGAGAELGIQDALLVPLVHLGPGSFDFGRQGGPAHGAVGVFDPSVDVAAHGVGDAHGIADIIAGKSHAHGVVAAAYIGVHKGLGHSGDVIQRDAQVAVGVGVDAQLVQPVLAHPAQDRDAVVGVRAGNTHQPAVKGCHAQAAAVVGIVEALDVVRGVLLVHIGQVIGQAVVHHLDKGVVAVDGQDVGQFARGDAGGQLVGVSVAACFKAVHQIHVELGFNVTGVGVVFKSLAFREQGSGRRFRKTAQGDGQGVHIGSVFVLGHGNGGRFIAASAGGQCGECAGNGSGLQK